jgi:small subunit ribosomal protein S17
MADDEKNEEIEEPTETPAEETPVAEEPEAAAEPEVVAEAPAEEQAAEAPAEEPAAEAPAEEPAAEAPAEEAAAEAPAEEAAPAAPAQVQGKKQRRLKHVPRSLRRTRSKTKREPASPRKPIVRIPKPESDRNARQERRGVVVSDKGDKTIIVKVDVQKIHPKYKKVVRSTTRFHAHDEANTAGVGDTVRIVETRPLSKLKHWRLAEIVEKAK